MPRTVAAPDPGPDTSAHPRDVELARVHRCGLHESTHYGAVVVVDADGGVQWQGGDVTRPVFHRSCAKPFQVTAMLEAGLRLPAPELALAAASHAGEPEHVAGVAAMLDAAGLTEDDLGCPPDLPDGETPRLQVLRAGGAPRRIFMNCSGKHAAMLRTCQAAGWPTAGYLDPAHPLQRRIRATVERVTDSPTHRTVGVDGCGAPVFATDLVGLARGYGALVSGRAGPSGRAVADAMRRHPQLVSGPTTGDTLLMTTIPGLLVKLGADGVQALALPDGRAAAFKIADGGERARLPVILAILRFLGVPTDAVTATSSRALAATTVLGGGEPVGSVVAAPGLFTAGR
jgi:L-asparaginase II